VTDRWGNVERFVLIGTLFILVALLTIITNDVVQLLNWTDQQAKVVADGFSAVVMFLVYLGIKAQLDMHAILPDRWVQWIQAASAAAFVAVGVATGQGVDQIAAFGAAGLLVMQPAIEVVVPRLPQRWLDRLEAVE